MKKTAVIIMFFTIISKIMGFVREVALSYFYGTSNISDAFLISLTIPVSIFSFIGAGITTGFIPIYSKIKSDEGINIANDFINNLINFIIIFSICILVLIFIFSPFVVRLFATGFDNITIDIASIFTRITIFSIVFNSIIYIFNGYLQVSGRFIFSTVVIIVFNIIAIVGIAMSTKLSVYLMPVSILMGVIIQSVFLVHYCYRQGFKYKCFINLKDTHLKDMFKLSIPIILGTSISQVNMLIDKTIASTITTGGISALNYAHKLQSFIIGMFVTSIGTILYPKISSLIIKKNISELKMIINKTMGYIFIILVPSMVGFMTLSETIIKLLFGRGAFNSEAILMTSNALFFYSLGLLGIGTYEILSRVFYAMMDTKKPVIIATIGVFINILLNIILSKYFGISGLALATSISSLISALLMYICLRIKIGCMNTVALIKSLFKMFISAFIMGIVVYYVNDKLNSILIQNTIFLIINFGCSVFVGVIVYFALLYILKVKEVDFFTDIIKKVINKFAK